MTATSPCIRIVFIVIMVIAVGMVTNDSNPSTLDAEGEPVKSEVTVVYMVRFVQKQTITKLTVSSYWGFSENIEASEK